MVIRQKKDIIPESYGNAVDRPFRPGAWTTGVIERNGRPEYAASYRAYCRKLDSSATAKRDG